MDRSGADIPEQGARYSVREYLRLWLPTAVYIVLIMAMAVRPSPKLIAFRHLDKYLHGLAYGILAVLSYRSFAGAGSRRAAVFTLLLGFAVGMSDEGLQALSRVRIADWRDLLADAIGTLIGTLIIARSLRRGRGPSSSRAPYL